MRPLLQIAEPGEAPVALSSNRLAVGIDLGTTHSLVATVQDDMPIVLLDSQGRALLPSVVQYRKEETPLVGYEALEAQAADAGSAIHSTKRLMGRQAEEIERVERLPYHLIDRGSVIRYRTVAGDKTPVEVSAEILLTLRKRAETALGGELAGAVITVPAYFNDAQRQATKDAATLAGLKVLRLLNEPTAAAIAYGLDTASEGTYVVFDLGGGTLDVSILRLSRGIFEVLAVAGDSLLGGDDFDQRIYCWIVDQLNLPPLSPSDVRLLMSRAREAKETLSRHAKTVIQADLSNGLSVDLGLSQQAFQEMTRPLVEKTMQPVRQALRDADLKKEDIKGVVMVGGATRMPAIQSAVATFFGLSPLNNIDPDKVVALGAAMQADLLVGNRQAKDNWLLLDVTPLSLGIETMGGLVDKIIPRNSTVPTVRAQDFTTYRDGQTAMKIHVVQGERDLVADCRSLATFELRGIPPMGAAMAKIRVTFQVDADGLLSVAATELTSGVRAEIVVQPAYGLSETDITDMLQASQRHAQDDARQRARLEARVEGQQLIDALTTAMTQDRSLLSDEEYADLSGYLQALEDALEREEAEAIRHHIDQLNKASSAFAARRMDRSIQAALEGQSIEALMSAPQKPSPR